VCYVNEFVCVYGKGERGGEGLRLKNPPNTPGDGQGSPFLS
jgi:hypothetical protein